MTYFSKDFRKFFKELESHNDRDWFNDNKKRYEENVKKPFHSFVEDCIDEAAKIDKSISISPKDAIFRIYRDVRFSKDKSPYKTHLGAVISKGGRKDHEYPGFYVHASHKSFTIGGGAYFLSKDNLFKVRQEIVYNPKEFTRLINAKKFKELYKEVKGEKNKIIPKPFKEEVGSQPLIANKQFYYMADLKPTILEKPDLIKTVREHFKTGAKINAFLTKAIYH